MSRISFDKQHNIEVPTLLLQNRNFDTIGRIAHASSLTYREHFNSADELSFTVCKDGNDSHSLWDSIVDFKIIYIPEFQERFEITVSTSSQQTDTKHITGTSLCEAELSQVKLYDLEINTETDILNSSYLEDFPTVFYRNPEMFANYEWKKDYTQEEKKHILRSSSLLHRILEKAEHYSITHVDESLMNEQRSFSISDTDIYSELTGEIAEEFGCLFLFDSVRRTISVYDLSHVCGDCGYRGDFSDCCPKCGSKNIREPYGQDTTIFISTENLATEISLDTNRDSLKNCFYVEGGDEIMTSAIRSLNPNGSSYFYCFSEEAKDDMPKELVQALDSYDTLYESYLSAKEFPLKAEAVADYNQVLTDIKRLFADENLDFQPLPDKLTGYPAVTSAIYDAIDLYEFLENSMMPTIHIDGLGLEESLQNIVQGFAKGFSRLGENGTATSFSNAIALRNLTTASQSTVENTIKQSAGLYYGKAYYELKVQTLAYTQATSSAPGSWTGTFALTSRTEKKPGTDIFLSKTSAPVTLSITSDAELFIQQSIYRKIADTEKGKYGDVTSLQMDFETFRKRIELYALMELHTLRNAFQACLDTIDTANISDKSLQERYHKFYFQRFQYIDTEMLPERERQLEAVAAMYHIDSGTLETSGLLQDIRQEINQALDFKKYVQTYTKDSETDLWKTFCACRREDKYTNSNYISDGMTNAQVLTHAKELVEAAQKELYKASHLQYTLSASMNDLLALKEFQPLAGAFSCGNWMNLGVDGKVYKLRLLSYQVNFDDVSAIDVEFSTVERLQSGASDVKSILQSASSMSHSYAGVMHQMSHSKQTSAQVQDWLKEGLNATQLKFVNSDSQDVVIDQHGILARQYDDVTHSYGDCQLKILGNGIYTTQDGWRTIQTGLGHISYYDPEKKETVEDYGLIAKAVVGKLLLGENLKIYNESGSMKFTGDGLEISNGINTFLVNPNADDALGLLQICKNNLRQFYINSNGDVCLSGSINIGDGIFQVDTNGNISSKGLMSFGNGSLQYDSTGLKVNGTLIASNDSKIAGWTATGSALYSGIYNGANPGDAMISTSDFSRTINGTSRNDLRLSVGNNFAVSKNGILYCHNADIVGKINASSGQIGGFTIGDKYLANSTSSLGANENSVYIGTDGISCGTGFTAHSTGACKIQGEITAKGGITLIGGTWTIQGPQPIFTPDTISIELKTGQKTYPTAGYGTAVRVTGLCLDDNLIINKMYTSDGTGTTAYLDKKGLYVHARNNKEGFAPVLRFSDNACTIGSNPSGSGNIVMSDNMPATINAYLDKVSVRGEITGKALGKSKAPWEHAYTDVLTLDPLNRRQKVYLNCPWADGELHGLLTVDKGHIVSIGWSGVITSASRSEDDPTPSISYDAQLNLRGETVRLSDTSGLTIGSDERLKHSMEDLDPYDEVYMDLQPLSFKYKNGTSGRKHFGFGAGQVRDSLEKHGFTTQDFAGFVQMKQSSPEDDSSEITDPMGLIYTEFVAWNTHMIQKLYKENQELKQRIEKLEGDYNHVLHRL